VSKTRTQLDEVMIAIGSLTAQRSELIVEAETLKRQVEVLAEILSKFTPPENFDDFIYGWPELTRDEQVKEWVKWSLGKAKAKG